VGCARKPTASSLAEAYFSKQPSRIGFLRYDTLALTLTLANIGSNRKVLVIEGSSGLVTGAVAERLGGRGEICAAHFGKKSPGIAISDMFNLSDSERSIIYKKSLVELLQEAHALESKSLETEQETHGHFDSCIITNQSYSIISALFATLPLLAPSASFAVACPHMQPLVETMNLLKIKGFAVGMSFIEPWYRELQILPHRTHPLMNMNHGGWYILCGTTTKAASMVDLSHYRTLSE
jgi:tRNA (adenine-N(1)-)-methyltransferase non-catalytic subunit